MDSKFESILIKYDRVSFFLEEAINSKGGEYSDRLAWTLSFADNANTILNYIKLPETLSNIFTESCQSQLLRREIDETLSLLPYNITCNGLLIYVDLLDRSQQEETAKFLYKQLQTHSIFQERALTFTFIKKLEEATQDLQVENFHCIRIEKEEIRTVEVSIDKQETALFTLSTQYFSIIVPFSLPIVLQSTVSEILKDSIIEDENILKEAVLNFKNTELLFSIEDKEISTNKDKIKDLIKSLKQTIKKSKDESTNFLTFIPVQEASLLFPKNPKNNIHPNGVIIEKFGTALTNNFEINGYFRFDCDLQKELQNFGKYLKNKINSIVKSQLNNVRDAHSQAVFAFSNNYTGISLIISQSDTEENNIETKKKYHSRLHLPFDKPFLRACDSLYSIKKSIEADTSGKLRDVHQGLNYKGVPGGKKYIIDGSYIYYHYMQDSFDDQGWGCAYRSLQTLLSWFKVQRLVPDFKVPSIPEIQKILIDMGDKPAAFAGSREWIGAFEVNLVLSKLLNVESRILYISSGAEIPSKARELKEHFLTEGTPIMIGGGVLAYTLLGIDYNESTGEIKFLILDPHFTGSDNLKTIQDKGWIGWKESKLFLDTAFYNFCLPQRKKFI